ncbi:hypothetical protein SCORR_v1c02210 [Spiroplasma corruscae]|uniref:ABC transporter ATP-binding protein n=1 Tax=Spiroplasma corruscae TaxID=216934 RepID=A0A222ENC7_9MOLU|nr:hypothetical protein [Spiroplasma corruscae]ASP27996.1 hypothetical protein SCORR_v1c02210 [Spiroplasma corruscae]
MKETTSQFNKTLIIVTHDIYVANQADEILLLKNKKLIKLNKKLEEQEFLRMLSKADYND